jgi:hypothetical protein
VSAGRASTVETWVVLRLWGTAASLAGSIVYLGMEVLSSPARPNFRHPPPLFMFMLGIWAAA